MGVGFRVADRRVAGGLSALMVLAVACSGPDREAEPPGSAVATAAVGSPDSGSPVRVVAVGDIACEAGEPVSPTRCQQAATAELTTSLNPDAVIALGDLQYATGSESDFEGSYAKSWGALKSITHPVPGNHEYGTPAASGYFAYLDNPAPWYAWDAGSWRIYMLNSNCGDVDCDAEEQWLLADLAGNERQCTAIAMHYPRYSSGKHGSNAFMSRFWEIAYDQRVDLALAGHDHTYERFAPMDASGAVRVGRGITSFVSGTGGKSLYDRGELENGSEYFQNSAFGVLSLTLSPDAFSWEFFDTDRSVLDQGSASCN